MNKIHCLPLQWFQHMDSHQVWFSGQKEQLQLKFMPCLYVVFEASTTWCSWPILVFCNVQLLLVLFHRLYIHVSRDWLQNLGTERRAMSACAVTPKLTFEPHDNLGRVSQQRLPVEFVLQAQMDGISTGSLLHCHFSLLPALLKLLQRWQVLFYLLHFICLRCKHFPS